MDLAVNLCDLAVGRSCAAYALAFEFYGYALSSQVSRLCHFRNFINRDDLRNIDLPSSSAICSVPATGSGSAAGV